MSRTPYSIPVSVKVKLEEMGRDLRIAQGNLIILSVAASVKSYEKRGKNLVADLVVPPREDEKAIAVEIPELVKRDLVTMAEALGLSQQEVVSRSVTTLVDHYGRKGIGVFEGLLF